MPTEPRHPADATLARLAEAFAAKNIPGVVADVSDAWSGTRFLPDWGAASWAGAAAELRSATLVSDSDGVRTYTIVRRGSSRQIEVRNHNGRWVLDYNSFRGPFPH